VAPHDSQICGRNVANVNNWTEVFAHFHQILRMVTMETVVNSTDGAQNFALHPAGMHFLVFFSPRPLSFCSNKIQASILYSSLPGLSWKMAVNRVLLHCALALSCGAVYCNRSCLWVCFVCVCVGVCVFVGVWVGGCVCYHDNSNLRASILSFLTKLGL